MKISYNWLKWYIPDAPEGDMLADIFTYHVTEVESVEKIERGQETDNIFDIKILPNRAHDLLSVHGIAREIASLLNIEFKDPSPMYKVPPSVATNLKIEIQSSTCRRYMGRIVRHVKVGPSPEWVVKHLESIGQRSINNIVDAANLVMFDCGQPIHCFDLDKVKGSLVVRQAKDGEEITTLDNKQIKLKPSDMVIADSEGALAIAGVKGGKRAEVDINTKNIIIEVASFDPVAVRKTSKSVNILTDAVKRYENDLSPELCAFGMLEVSGLVAEYGATEFEEVIDMYPKKQETRKLSFSVNKISKILGLEVSIIEIGNILERYKFGYKNDGDIFEITVPAMRLDLQIEEDVAEEIGRVLGYDKLKPEIPKINFSPKQNETYQKIALARNKLLEEGYSEVMTYGFASKGEVEVLQSASDKKFLRANLADGLKESLKLNQVNTALLGTNEIKIFEIGTVFLKDKEEIHVAYGNKKEIKEVSLEEFCKNAQLDTFSQALGSPSSQPDHSQKHTGPAFKMWSLFPFIARDVAVWVGEEVGSDEVSKVIKENAGELLVRGPEIFDEFKKDGKVSYAFRLVFQSFDRTLTDSEINAVMENIHSKIQEQGWQVR